MSDPVGLFVETDARVEHLQRQHDPAVLTVLRIGRMQGYRFSSILVEEPRNLTPTQHAIYEEWLEWLPTRLPPGERERITRLR